MILLEFILHISFWRVCLPRVETHLLTHFQGLHFKDADEAMARAVRAGAIVVDEITEIPELNWRRGNVKDPFGYVWPIISAIKEEEPLNGAKGFLMKIIQVTNLVFNSLSAN